MTVKRKNATSPAKVRNLDHTEQALQLRAAGRSYREIASELGISAATVYRLVVAEMERRRNETAETAEMLLGLEVARLDKLTRFHHGVMDNAARPIAERQRSADALLRLSERRSKLLGLDAPSAVSFEITAQAEEFMRLLTDAVGRAVLQFEELPEETRANLLERIAGSLEAVPSPESLNLPPVRLLEAPTG